MPRASLPGDLDARNYQRIPGDSARRYVSTSTGEIISRRQFDQIFRLPQQGYRSYEEKAKTRREAGVPAGPARGRKGAPVTRGRPVRTGHRVPATGAAHGPNTANPLLPTPPVHVTSKRLAHFALSQAREDGRSFDAEVRLKIVLYDTEGNPHMLGSRGGIRPQMLANVLAAGGSWIDAMYALAADLDYEIDGWEFSGEADVYFVGTLSSLPSVAALA